MKNKVLATILFSLLVVPLVQSADNSPRLVVGITVDQLRTDYLEALQHLFGEKGFKRLMREGVVCENLVFDLRIGRLSRVFPYVRFCSPGNLSQLFGVLVASLLAVDGSFYLV